MSTTVKDLAQRAVATRTSNDPGKVAKAEELIERTSMVVRALYARANQLNPWYFSLRALVTPSGGAWSPNALYPTPLHVYGGGAAGTGADKVLTGTDPVVDRVYIVNVSDPAAELAPRIYRLGRAYYTIGETGDPSSSDNGDKLTFILAQVHTELDSTVAWDHANNTLDSSWPQHHNLLLVTELELFLARKDGRNAEIPGIERSLERLLAAFDAEVIAADQTSSTRRGQRPSRKAPTPVTTD